AAEHDGEVGHLGAFREGELRVGQPVLVEVVPDDGVGAAERGVVVVVVAVGERGARVVHVLRAERVGQVHRRLVEDLDVVAVEVLLDDRIGAILQGERGRQEGKDEDHSSS
ncbi:MAG: hypothetical protein ACK56F_27940, partial [bacterium]